MKLSRYFFTFYVLLSLLSCHNNPNEVVVYTSVDQVFSQPVLQAFEKETGIKVKAVYDTEETKSTGILNRLIAEKDNAQCDVFWSGDPIRTMVLKQKGITRAYFSKNAEDIPDSFKDKEGHWTGFSARARVLLYHKKQLKNEEIPQSVFDFTQEKYKGKIAIANPLFGTTSFHIAALFTVLGDQKAKEFLQALKNNEIVIATSNGDVKKQVLQGKVACGLTDTDDAFEAMKEHNDVGIVFLDQQGIGSLIMPNTVSLIQHAPHTENGKILIDYLLRKQTERMLAKSCAQMPLHKGVELPQGIPSLDHIKPMQIDYDKTAIKLQEIQNYLKQWVKK